MNLNDLLTQIENIRSALGDHTSDGLFPTCLRQFREEQGVDQLSAIELIAKTFEEANTALVALQTTNQELERQNQALTAQLEQVNWQLREEVIKSKQFGAALNQRELEFKALVENAPDVIARYDQEFRHVYINPAVELTTGIPFQNFIGKNFQELGMPNSVWHDWQQALQTVFETNSEQEIEFQLPTPFGLKYYQSRLVHLATDGFETVLAIIRDVTTQKEVEAALLQSEERFRTSIDNMLDCFAIYTSIRDQSGKIVDFKIEYFNTAACEKHLTTKELRIGKNLCELVPAILMNGSFDEYVNVVETGKPLIKEDLIYEDVLEAVQLAKVFDLRIVKLGDGFAVAWRDITESKQAQLALQESEQRFRQLAENINEVFWMVTPEDRNIIYVSPAYDQIWGRSREVLYHNPMSWIEAIYPEDRDRVRAAIKLQSQHIETNGYCELEYRIVRPDGEIRWIYDRGFGIPDQNGVLYRFVGIAEDITGRKLTEFEACNALIKERELNDLKSRFVSMTSHEFRTPLTTIQSSTELLERYYLSNDPRPLRHLVRIQKAVAQMTQMLDDILIIGETESGKLDFNPVSLDLVAFCRHLAEELQPSEQTIIFNYHNTYPNPSQNAEPGQFTQLNNCLPLFDEKLLRRILNNLLVNALKYSPPNSIIKFELHCLNNTAIFQIKDQGIGIPPEDQARLFEPFHRATNVGTIQGTGLGLAIVKQCVDLHRGEITVDSVPGNTTFTVKLPLSSSTILS